MYKILILILSLLFTTALYAATSASKHSLVVKEIWITKWTQPEVAVIRVIFNQSVDKASLEKHLFFTHKGKRIPVQVQSDSQQNDGKSWLIKPGGHADGFMTLKIEPGVLLSNGELAHVKPKKLFIFYARMKVMPVIKDANECRDRHDNPSGACGKRWRAYEKI